MEARWNAALQKVQELENKLRQFDAGAELTPMPDKDVLLSLAQALPATGGRHSELRVKKKKTGQHGQSTSIEAIAVLQKMAGNYTDEQIAPTLKRLGLQTGMGHPWSEQRVYSARKSRPGVPSAFTIPSDRRFETEFSPRGL